MPPQGRKKRPGRNKIPVLQNLLTQITSRDHARDFNWPQILEKAIVVLMSIHIFFVPFPHTTAIKEITFYLSCTMALVLLCRRGRPLGIDSPLMLPFGLFLGWACLGIAFSLDRPATVHDLYAHLFRYLVFYWILSNLFNSREGIVTLSWVVIVAATAFPLGGLIYYYGILGNGLTVRFTANCHQISPNVVGITTIFPILLALQALLMKKHTRTRLILLLCLIPLLLSTLMTQSRGTFIALFLGLVLLFSRNWKSTLVAFASVSAIMVAVIALTPVKDRFANSPDIYSISGNIRLTINYISLEVIKDHPVMGIGFGNQIYGEKIDRDAYNQRVPEKYRLTPDAMRAYPDGFNDPHNMFFNIAVRVGLVGLLFFGFILLRFFKMAWSNMARGRDTFIRGCSRAVFSGLMVFLTIGFFEPVFSHMQEGVLFTLFSMMTILWRLNQDSAGERPGPG